MNEAPGRIYAPKQVNPDFQEQKSLTGLAEQMAGRVDIASCYDKNAAAKEVIEVPDGLSCLSGFWFGIINLLVWKFQVVCLLNQLRMRESKPSFLGNCSQP